MGETTGISWTDKTWNPWIGCEKVSPGCLNCYAEAIETRAKRDFSTVRRAKDFTAPMRWQRKIEREGDLNKRQLVFSCSMSDFFHVDADPFRQEAWGIIQSCPNLTFQILTKRSSRIKHCVPASWQGRGPATFEGGVPFPNVWLGVSVESPDYYFRIRDLQKVPAVVRFLSLEPLLAPLPDLPLEGISWVIVGGESGKGYRPMEHEWASDILAQCRKAGVAFFGKQRAGPRNELRLAFDVHSDGHASDPAWADVPGEEIKEFPKVVE